MAVLARIELRDQPIRDIVATFRTRELRVGIILSASSTTYRYVPSRVIADGSGRGWHRRAALRVAELTKSYIEEIHRSQGKHR